MLKTFAFPLCVGVGLVMAFGCASDDGGAGVKSVPGGAGKSSTGSGGSNSNGSGGSSSGGTQSASGGGNGKAGENSGTGGSSGSSAGSAGASSVPDITEVYKSSGCGMDPPEGQKKAGYTKYSVHVTGATLTDKKWPEHDRAYHVWIPPDYDANKAYRTVFIGYGCGNKFAGDTATYKLMNSDPQAIYVGMDMPPIDTPPDGACYNDDGGASSTEWEFFALMAKEVESRFCVDKNRVYAAGYSSGSWLANMLGCYFAGHDPNRKFGPDISVRGTMKVTGGLPAIPECGGKVAALWIHDSEDQDNKIGGNINALNRVLAANGCTGSPQAAWGEGTLKDICKQYTACPKDYPVVFCTTTGRAHTAQDDNALKAFPAFMDMMDPAP